MIVIYPMLCSNTVNYSSVPGIAKAMERYILIHRLDDVLKQSKREFQSARGRLVLKEDHEINNEMFHILTEEEKDHRGRSLPGGTEDEVKNETREIKKEREKLEKEREKLEKEKEKMEDEERKSSIDQKIKDNINRDIELKDKEKDLKNREKEIEQRKRKVVDATSKVTMHMDSLSLEPTWMYVDRYIKDDKITDLIGVKVLPIMVSSDEKMINLLMYDKNLKGLNQKIVSLGRSTKKKVYDLYKRAINRIPIVRHFLGKRGSVKGDVKKDIILAKSSFRENIFVCINKLDLEDDFFKSTQDVNKLFKMGWGSIVAMDDSQKTAYFCVKEFKGICFPVQYGYIFSTLGKDHGKVFDDLTDVKKSSGGLFRRKTPSKKLVENIIYDNHISDPTVKVFSEIEKVLLKEDFKAKRETMGILRQVKDFMSTLKTGDHNKIQANLNRQTKYKNTSEVKRDMTKDVPGFKKGYELGKSTLKKKLKFKRLNSTRILEAVAMMIGIYAVRDYSAGTLNSMEHTKKFISKIELNIDKNVEDYKKKKPKDEEYDSDYILGMAVFTTICLLISPVIVTFLYISITNPHIYIGLLKLVLGALMFIPWFIYWIISSILVPAADFLISTWEKSRELLSKVKQGLEYIKDMTKTANELEARDVLDWMIY